MKTVTVYGLYSTRDNELRYVGQTTGPLKARLSQHKSYAKIRNKTAVHKWVNRELLDGFFIEIRPIQESAVLHETEIALIAQFKASGARLLNLTDGGEGTIGWEGNKGIKRPDVAERNRQAAGKPNGRKNSDEARAKISAALTGRPKPYMIIRNKTNHPWIGKNHSEDTKEKMRAAWMIRKERAKNEQVQAVI